MLAKKGRFILSSKIYSNAKLVDRLFLQGLKPKIISTCIQISNGCKSFDTARCDSCTPHRHNQMTWTVCEKSSAQTLANTIFTCYSMWLIFPTNCIVIRFLRSGFTFYCFAAKLSAISLGRDICTDCSHV